MLLRSLVQFVCAKKKNVKLMNIEHRSSTMLMNGCRSKLQIKKNPLKSDRVEINLRQRFCCCFSPSRFTTKERRRLWFDIDWRVVVNGWKSIRAILCMRKETRGERRSGSGCSGFRILHKQLSHRSLVDMLRENMLSGLINSISSLCCSLFFFLQLATTSNKT